MQETIFLELETDFRGKNVGTKLILKCIHTFPPLFLLLARRRYGGSVTGRLVSVGLAHSRAKVTLPFLCGLNGLYDWKPDFFDNLLVCYKNISRTSAVSSTNFGSILIFASCVVGTCN